MDRWIEQWDMAVNEWAAGMGWPAEGFLRLTLAAIAGGLVGLEREIRGRNAGFRTNLLVCVGSTLAMLVSLEFAQPGNFNPLPGIDLQIDPARIAYGVMTGIGFLGAGTIIQDRGSVRGLTTAAGMWSVTAIGLAIGVGAYMIAAFATVMLVVTLWLLDYVTNRVPKQQFRLVTIRRKWDIEIVDETSEWVKNNGLSVVDASYRRTDDFSLVDIAFTVGFIGSKRYTHFERKTRESPRYDLVASESI